MKNLILLFVMFFMSLSYAQSSDELKLWNGDSPYIGKVILIKKDAVQFKMDSTDFVFEFDKVDIEYIKSSNGQMIRFNNSPKSSDEITIQDQAEPETYSEEKIIGLTLYFNFQFTGKHDVSIPSFGSGSVDVNSAASLGLDYDALNIKNFLRIGAGFTYQFPRSFKNVEGSFNFVPIYAYVKFGSKKQGRTNFYIMPAFGYNIFSGDENYTGNYSLKGDLYFGVGFGFIISNHFDIRGFYNRYNGFIELPEPLGDAKITYSGFAMYFGYRF